MPLYTVIRRFAAGRIILESRQYPVGPKPDPRPGGTRAACTGFDPRGPGARPGRLRPIHDPAGRAARRLPPHLCPRSAGVRQKQPAGRHAYPGRTGRRSGRLDGCGGNGYGGAAGKLVWLPGDRRAGNAPSQGAPPPWSCRPPPWISMPAMPGGSSGGSSWTVGGSRPP